MNEKKRKKEMDFLSNEILLSIKKLAEVFSSQAKIIELIMNYLYLNGCLCFAFAFEGLKKTLVSFANPSRKISLHLKKFSISKKTKKEKIMNFMLTLIISHFLKNSKKKRKKIRATAA